ncbi:hypothetical protein HYU06_02650 [Candidatus Woesearchaeota archaeon]|nr:hypothetical protein [Candidatus Woesearchaeota archaeon]
MAKKSENFFSKNKAKIIILGVIVVLLLIFFLIGTLSSGKNLNYIPV